MSKMLVLCMLLALHAAAGAAAGPLPSDLDAVLDRYRVPREHIGLYIARVGGDKAIAVNATKPFNPASVIKLLPSLAALESLSPAYQWHTRVYQSGRVNGGTLNGNLYIQGGGDPYLTVESMWALLKNVRAQGIDRINGDIVVDDGVFAGGGFDRAAFDDKPYRLYNGPANGLMVNFWAVRFTVRALPDGVHIDAFPSSERLQVINNVQHSSKPCTSARRRVRYSIKQAPGSVVVAFNGVLSSRCRPIVLARAVIPDERYVQYVLPGLWRDAGGALDGKVRPGTVPEKADQLVSHPSRSLGEVVRATNKFSNNMMARHLLLTLGTTRAERGIRMADGIEALNDWILARGLDVPGLRIVNGSGLSRDTRISARGMANLLRAGFHSRYAPEFLTSLPIAGEDRVLDERAYRGSGAAIVRIKTGLIDHVRAMAGYVMTPGGERYIVVLLVNHPNIHRGLGTRMQDAIIRYVLDL